MSDRHVTQRKMPTLEALARAQHGAVSRKQALAAGVSSSGIARRVARGDWRPVDDGVYVVGGARPSWLQAAMVATLATSGVTSHRTAARLWKLPVPGPMTGEPIDVLVSADRRPRSTLRLRVHRTRAAPATPSVRLEGIPVSPLGPTLLQLAEVLDPPALGKALRSALKHRPALRAWLGSALAGPQRGRPAALKLRALVGG